MNDFIKWFFDVVYRLRPEVFEAVISLFLILSLLNYPDTGGG